MRTTSASQMGTPSRQSPGQKPTIGKRIPIRLVDDKYVAIEKGTQGHLTDAKARNFLLQFENF